MLTANQVSGKEKMIAGWRGYFEWFPDYYIEVTEVFEDEDKLALFGFAGGTFKNKEGESWRLPAAWKAIVKDGRVTLWQVLRTPRFRLRLLSGIVKSEELKICECQAAGI